MSMLEAEGKDYFLGALLGLSVKPWDFIWQPWL